MKQNYYARFLWCLTLLWISTLTPVHAQTSGSTIVKNIVLETEGTILPIIATSDGGVGLLTVGAPNQPIILNKINEEGQILWRKNITRFGRESGFTSNRRVIQMIGTSDGGFALIGTYQEPAVSSSDYSVVVKFNADGNQAWYKEILIQTGPVPSRPAQIIETGDGGYLVTIDTNMPKIVSGVGVVKLNAGGNIAFSRYYDLPGSNPLAMASIHGVVEMSPGFALIGSYLPNYATNRTFEEGAIFQLITNNGDLYKTKTFYPADQRFTDVRYDPLANALLLKTTKSGSGNQSVIKSDLDGNILFRYDLTESEESSLTTAKINLAPFSHDGFIITDSKNGVDFRLTHLNQNGAVVTSQTFGGSGRELLYDTRVLRDSKILLTGLTNSRDGDLANRMPSPFNERVWMLTLNFPSFSTPTTPPPPPTPTPSGFALTTPTYDCNTGQLVLNTSGGNGSTIEYRIIGNRDWSTSNVFSIPAHQRQGTTFTLDARQSGQVMSIGFTSACGTTPPPTTAPPTNPPPTTGPPFVVQSATFDCNTGILTPVYRNETGLSIEFQVAGIRGWGPSSAFVVPTWQRNGTTFELVARLSNGHVSSIQFTTNCPNARLASTESTAQLDALVLPNPVSGNELVVEVTGANGQPVDFALSDMSGKVLTIQRAEAISDRHRQTLPAGNLIEGVYLLRVSTGTQSKTVKVLKR